LAQGTLTILKQALVVAAIFEVDVHAVIAVVEVTKKPFCLWHC